MLAHVYSCAVIGLDGVTIDVEVDYGQGNPGRITVVGLPDEAVRESRERVYSAIKNSELGFPRKPITVNLAPASVRKEGPAFDLPIAVGVIITYNQVPPQATVKIQCSWVNSRWMAPCAMCAVCFPSPPMPARKALKKIVCARNGRSRSRSYPGYRNISGKNAQ